MYVCVENVASKVKPSIWGKDGTTFVYGDAVEVLNVDGSWCRVSNKENGLKGWLKESVLTTKKIKAKKRISLDASELALAGKGFSSPMEAEYSKKFNKNFDDVDEMEKNSVEVNDRLLGFIKEGKLRGEE